MVMFIGELEIRTDSIFIMIIKRRFTIKKREHARIFIENRIGYFNKFYNFEINRIAIKNTSTRWGSCSSKNNINLNINLVTLPEQLQDYVLLHELVHTKHKNHGKAFWMELDRLVGNAKELRKEMRKYRLTPIRPKTPDARPKIADRV